MDAVNLFCRAALNSGELILPSPVLDCIGAGSLHTCMTNKFRQVLLQRHYACCQPVLHSSTEQWGTHFAISSAALHWCWVTTHLYEEQICTGVIAVTQCML